MKRKTSLIAPILLFLVILSATITPAAANVNNIHKAFVLGTVKWIEQDASCGLILVKASESDKAMVFAITYIPEFKEIWFIRLVEVEFCVIGNKDLVIGGTWTVYVNCKLSFEGYGFIGVSFLNNYWHIEGIDIKGQVRIEGSVICHWTW